MDLVIEFIVELIFELIFEGGKEICTNKKISKWIRYPILVIFILIIGAFTLGLIYLGIIIFRENIAASLFCITLGVIFLISFIYKFKKAYIKKKGEN